MSTASPTILKKLLQHSVPVAWRGRGICRNAWRNGLLERSRIICIEYDLIAGMR